MLLESPVRVALVCEASVVILHSLLFYRQFLHNNWGAVYPKTKFSDTAQILMQFGLAFAWIQHFYWKHIDGIFSKMCLTADFFEITAWPKLWKRLKTMLSPSHKLFLPFWTTHRRVKLKVSIHAATGSMAVACLFSAVGLRGCHRVICWLPSLTPRSDVRRAAAACLLRAATF